MKAAILEKLNAPLMVDKLQWPDKLECGQVLVKVHASGICGAQRGEISGTKGEDKYLPHLLGHEGGGVVMDVGPGVTQVKKGDHVVMHWRKGAGIEAAPPKYKWGDKTVSGKWVTTFNEYAIVSENRVTPIEKDIPFEIAALMGCAVTTGLGLVNNEAQLKIGQSIAVIGCGGVGLNIIQGAVMVSAGTIIAIDILDNKLEMAAEFGATKLIKPDLLSVATEAAIRHIGKPGVDVVVDCTGLVNMIDIGYSLVAPGGKMILVGQPRHDQKLTINAMRRHYCGQTLFDSQGGLTNPSTDIPRYLDLYRAGKLKLDSLITHRYPLEQVNDALDMVRSGQAGRVILEMKGD
ncbi:MAG: zinc-binding dehydrogenase [Methylococcaceae bacterium]